MSVSSNSLQVSLHRLPFPAKTDLAGCQGDHSNDLGAGTDDHVPFGSDTDRGACQASLHGAQHGLQPHIPTPVMLRELGRPTDEEGLHHSPVCPHLPDPTHSHYAHVRPHRHQALHHVCHFWERAAGKWWQSECRQASYLPKKDQGDQNVDCGGPPFYALLAPLMDPHASDGLRRSGTGGA